MIDGKIYPFVTIFLLALIVFLEVRAFFFIKELLDRLMSRDLPELVHSQKERKQKKKDQRVDTIQL